MTSAGDNRLMTMAETADYLSVPLRTLQGKWRQWQIPAVRVGRSLRFRVRSVEQWLAEREVV